MKAHEAFLDYVGLIVEGQRLVQADKGYTAESSVLADKKDVLWKRLKPRQQATCLQIDLLLSLGCQDL